MSRRTNQGSIFSACEEYEEQASSSIPSRLLGTPAIIVGLVWIGIVALFGLAFLAGKGIVKMLQGKKTHPAE